MVGSDSARERMADRRWLWHRDPFPPKQGGVSMATHEVHLGLLGFWRASEIRMLNTSRCSRLGAGKACNPGGNDTSQAQTRPKVLEQLASQKNLQLRCEVL